MTQIDIQCGDAVKLMKDLPDNSVDLIIADPPYNLGKNYGNNNDQLDFEEYLEFTRSWTGQASRVLSTHGTMYIFMGVRFISYLYGILERENKLEFNSWVVWHYTQGLGKTKGFSPRHDDILVFNKSKLFKFNLDDVRVPQKSYRERNNMRGANPGDVWTFSHVHYCNSNRQKHPTQKPEGLIERMVLASSDKGDTVLDPFVGSGTTMRVCQQIERNGVGFELNPAYIEITKARLAEPFSGFDSIDLRMARVPSDLRDDDIRAKYLENHEKWFLRNHETARAEFSSEVERKYGVKERLAEEAKPQQKELL